DLLHDQPRPLRLRRLHRNRHRLLAAGIDRGYRGALPRQPAPLQQGLPAPRVGSAGAPASRVRRMMKLGGGLAVAAALLVLGCAPAAQATDFCVPNLAACPSGVGVAKADLEEAMGTDDE